MPIWCHSSSSFLGFGPASSISYPTLYFLPTFIISLINFGIASFFPVSFHDWNIQLILFSFAILGVFCRLLKIIWSTTYAQSGLSFLGARYFFSHIICIVSILVSILGMFSPPISLGCDASFQFIVAFLSFHRKSFICFSILF